MKGFPNQVADLAKLADGLAVIERMNADGRNPKNDDTLGEELVRAGVLGTGHTPKPVDEYLREQRAKLGGPSNQSHRTGARGLREQYRLLALIDDSGDRVELTDAGRRVASFAGQPLDDAKREYWRRLVRNINHPGRDGVRSHPYQVLLRLVGRAPGITRAKCALALEARDDSDEELDRIVTLADLDEREIIQAIGETRSNWNNAKKILPKFAEQLEDVTKSAGRFYLASVPGGGDTEARAETPTARQRGSRAVTPDTIARSGTAEGFDEVELPIGDVDPAVIAAAINVRRGRLRRHNLLVREIARRYADAGLALYEAQFDCLALTDTRGYLNEVKTLDGTPSDEAAQVREALGQLLYYKPFVERDHGSGVIHLIAAFESRISDDHVQVLSDNGIVAIWKERGQFSGGLGADEILGHCFEELR